MSSRSFLVPTSYYWVPSDSSSANIKILFFKSMVLIEKGTMPKISRFVGWGVELLEFLIWCFYDFVKIDNFKFFVLFWVGIFNEFVDFPETFPESWVEVILDAIVCSVIKYRDTCLWGVRQLWPTYYRTGCAVCRPARLLLGSIRVSAGRSSVPPLIWA